MNPLLFVLLAAVASAVPLERKEAILDPLGIHGFQTIGALPTVEISKDKEIKPIVLNSAWDPVLRSQFVVSGSGLVEIPNIGLSGGAVIRPPILGADISSGIGLHGGVLGTPFFPQVSLVGGAGAVIDRPRPIEDKKEEKREESIGIKSKLTTDKDLNLVPIVHDGLSYYHTIPTTFGGDIIRPIGTPIFSDFVLTTIDGKPLNKTIDRLPIPEEFKPISGIHPSLILV